MARSGYLATVVIFARHHQMARTRRIALSLLRRVHPEDTEDDAVVWDVPNPFAPPDPSQAHLHSLIQAEIARMRRCESIGPLQSELDDDDDEDYDEYSDDGDNDADDEDDEGEDNDADDDEDEDEDSHSDHESTKVLLPPSPSDTSSSDGDWNHLPQVYNDLAEAEELERATRKAKRDAHRSRLKALAILGPEALSALHL